MKRKVLLSAVFLTIIFFFACNSGNERSEKLQNKIEAIQESPEVEGALLHNPEIIYSIYEEKPEIVLEKWGSKEKVDQMIFTIKNIYKEGLNPKDYHLERIEALAEKVFSEETSNAEEIAQLELLLSDAFLIIASHLSAGKTDPEKIDPQWKALRRNVNINFETFVDSVLQNESIEESLKSLTPNHREYILLKEALNTYRQIASKGGWEIFQTSLPKLEKGMNHPDVKLLRKRLSSEQKEIDTSKNTHLFDEKLQEQVILFQTKNGLTPDGAVGKKTIETLNISVEEKIAAIEANLERWRWLDPNLGDRYIKVNIANYELQVVENEEVVLSTKAIVGKSYRKTPVFSSKMTYLVLAPSWTLPPTILKNDVIPAVIKNPSYLRQQNMKVLRKDGSEVDPSIIDWKNLSSFPYRIQQAPGKNNALGDVKFMFPNQYSVYIHDTPARDLFNQTERSFSSGCIRINKPLELAAYLLQDKPEWTISEIKKTIESSKERNISIQNPIPVHILYITAWVDENGDVHFRKDIYNRDAALLEALKHAPPKVEVF